MANTTDWIIEALERQGASRDARRNIRETLVLLDREPLGNGTELVTTTEAIAHSTARRVVVLGRKIAR